MTLPKGSHLKGAAATILYTMCMPQFRGVELGTNKLIDETGYTEDPLNRGLRKLVDAGLVHCTGTHGKGGELHYILATTAPMLLPTPDAALEAPADPSEDAPRTQKILERGSDETGVDSSRTQNLLERDPENAPRTQKILERPELRDSELSINVINNTDSNSGAPPGSAGPAVEPETAELEERYKRALEVGGVYKNIRRALAAEFAKKGPDYLLQILGHIAYCYDDQTTQQRGVYVKDAAEHRDPAPDGYLPPAHLTFDEALTWAKNGGHTDAELAALREQELAARASFDQPAADRLGGSTPTADQPPPKPPDDPRLVLWRAVLAHLQLEMTPGNFDLRVRDTRLYRADRAGMIFEIACPNRFTYDWLSNRLTASVERALRQVFGLPVDHPVSVTFTCEPTLYDAAPH